MARRRGVRSACAPVVNGIGLTLAAALLFVVGTREASAQARPVRDSIARDSVARDSIAARLARAEANIELLRKQLAVETETMVRTRSRLKLELSARIMTNAFATSDRVNNHDSPQLVLAPSVANAASTPGRQSLGATVRQSRVGAALSVDSVLGGHFDGDFELDFYGGASAGPGDRRLFPEPRMRTARARISWARTELMVGSATPLISDLNPMSVAAVGLPGFVAAGNLWNWIPQVRVTRELVTTGDSATGIRIAIQGAALSPFSNAQHVSEPDATDAGERSVRPFLEGRVRARWGDADGTAASDADLAETGGEIGIGVHHGWVRADGDSTRTSRAVSADFRVTTARGIELRGEAYSGRLLRGLGGGGIAQNFGRLATGTVPPPVPATAFGASLRDRAAWLQVNARLHPVLIAGAGCGIDKVNSADLPARDRNSACAVHLLWRPAQPIIIGAEARTLSTRYPTGTYRASHFNLAFGFEM